MVTCHDQQCYCDNVFDELYLQPENLSQATGRHFTSAGHSISDMKICIVEKVYSEERLLREEREKEYIRLFNSKFKGLNIDT